MHTALASTIMQFMATQLALLPREVFIDEHEESITVTMKGVLPDAERDSSKDRRVSELVVKAHVEAFRAVRGVLIAKCSDALHRHVETATLLLDTQSNTGTIVLSLKEASSQAGGVRQ